MVTGTLRPTPRGTPRATGATDARQASAGLTPQMAIVENDRTPTVFFYRWLLTTSEAAARAAGGAGFVPITLQIIAGAGLAGGGPLSADVRLDVIPATAAKLGGVKIGANITVAADGTISVAPPGAGGGIPGGAVNEFQFNSAGAFGGAAGFVWDAANLIARITGGAGAGFTAPIFVATNAGVVLTFQNANNAFWVNGAGNGLFTGALYLNGAAGISRYLTFATAGATRWTIGANGGAESGANAGSNFAINSIADAGTGIGTPFFIARATGRVGIGTTTPAYALDVAGDANITGVYRVNGVPISTGGVTVPGANTQVIFNNAGALGADAGLTYTLATKAVAIGGALTAGGLITGPQLNISDVAGTNRPIRFQTSGSSRWLFRMESGAETGANAGSDFTIYRVADDGSSATSAIAINRASGNVGIGILTPATPLDVAAALSVSGAAGTNRYLYLRTGAAARWAILADASAESGGDAGSGLVIYRCHDNGVLFDPALAINRATGAVALSQGLTVGGNCTIGGFFGIGAAAPQAALHIYGNVPVSPPSTATPGGALLLDDSNAAGGSGGMVIFGAGNTWRFAAIRGYATDGTPNTRGDIVFYTRRANTDATLTETMRLTSGGLAQFAGALNVPGGFTVAGANMMTFPTVPTFGGNIIVTGVPIAMFCQTGTQNYEPAMPNGSLIIGNGTNLNLVFRLKGTDGVVRQAILNVT